LVKGLIPRTGLVVIWGPAKCGKSFFIFDLVMHIVLGLAYRGRRVVQGSVIYLALEGGEGFKARVEAFRIEHLAEEPAAVPFFLVTTPVSLTADREHLVQSIKAQVGLNVPAAVVIDTLNRSLVGSESSDLDMSAYIKAADVIRDALGCVVIIVHHSGVDATRPRGHTSLTGAADTQIAVKRDALDNIIATVEWMKDGPEGARWYLV
jgi:RecA-family ATPase